MTTTFLVSGILLLLSWPFVVGARPPKFAPRKEQIQWGRGALLYFGLTSGTWLCAATSALLLARQTRMEFLNQNAENLKSLAESSLRDHGKHI